MSIESSIKTWILSNKMLQCVRSRGEMEISVIIPLYNEAEYVRVLHERVEKALKGLSCEYEIICVDDASSDGTLEALRQLRNENSNLRIISLEKRKGQSTALFAGFKKAKGMWLVTMDGDLQDPPEEIEKLLPFRKNFDFIKGIRTNRKSNFLRRGSSVVGKFFTWLVLGSVIKDPGCSLRIFKKEVVGTLPLVNNFHRFLPFLAKISGFSVKEVNIKHEKRIYGKSKYGIFKRGIEGIFDLCGMFWLKKRIITYRTKDEC